jgi:hypothetical protein
MISGSQSSQNYDDQNIVNTTGPSGASSTTISPNNIGSDYYLKVSSDCDWSITVKTS